MIVIKLSRVVFVLFIILLIAGCGPTLVVDRTTEGQPILIRSPQPDLDDLKKLYNDYKINTIINLRGAEIAENPNVKWHSEEKCFSRTVNITYLTMDLNDGTQPPSKADIDLYLHIMSDRNFWPVLIHCQAGIHRTGFFTALYRIQFNVWTPEEAIKEMESYWYNWSISDRSAIKAFLRHFQPYELKQGDK